MPRWEALGRTIVAPDDPTPKIMGIAERHPRQLLRRRPLRPDEAAIAARACALAAKGPTSSTSAASRRRPGAEPVPLHEELRRVVPVVEAVAAALGRADLDRHHQGRGGPAALAAGR